VHQADQQAVAHVVTFVRAVPESPVVILLTLLETCQADPIVLHDRWLAERGEMRIEPLDEGVMSRLKLRGEPIQAQRISGLPL